MIFKLILFVLALLMLTACTGTRDGRTASNHSDYNPCKQMKLEAEAADELEDDVRALSRKAHPRADAKAVEHTAAQVTAQSLLAQKEKLLALTLQSMQQTAQACAARSQPFDRYRTVPEREESL